MKIRSIKTRILRPPQDDLLAVIKKSLHSIEEGSIIVITSKVVSIWQGRCVSKKDAPDKDALIIKESDKYIPRDLVPGKWLMHTIKNNLLIPTAGIDESNADGFYVLWPDRPHEAAKRLYAWFKKNYCAKKFGVIITDSHSIPLRRGTIGISIAHYGFDPLKDYRRLPDLFGRKLKVTQSNIVDSLAAAAVLVMGEGDESTPLAVITDVPFVKFTKRAVKRAAHFSSLEVEEKEDLYYPFLSSVPWKRKT